MGIIRETGDMCHSVLIPRLWRVLGTKLNKSYGPDNCQICLVTQNSHALACNLGPDHLPLPEYIAFHINGVSADVQVHCTSLQILNNFECLCCSFRKNNVSYKWSLDIKASCVLLSLNLFMFSSLSKSSSETLF